MWRRVIYFLTGLTLLYFASRLLMREAEDMKEVALMAAMLSCGFGGVILLLLSVAPYPKIKDGSGL